MTFYDIKITNEKFFYATPVPSFFCRLQLEAQVFLQVLQFLRVVYGERYVTVWTGSQLDGRSKLRQVHGRPR